jgi:membrane-bound inhibitor of C-type lysozyme
MSKTTKRPSRKMTVSSKKALRKAVGMKRPTKKSSGRKTHRYQQGKPTLSIAYNGIGNEFVFTLDQYGKVDTKFNVDVQHILTIMGVPLSVSPI